MHATNAGLGYKSNPTLKLEYNYTHLGIAYVKDLIECDGCRAFRGIWDAWYPVLLFCRSACAVQPTIISSDDEEPIKYSGTAYRLLRLITAFVLAVPSDTLVAFSVENKNGRHLVIWNYPSKTIVP
ncbi:hypothetical protein CHU98_g6652 [Xylaria longipes]|nr:hypothetical protein CHU98_g6652 [Xylaria longipes]